LNLPNVGDIKQEIKSEADMDDENEIRVKLPQKPTHSCLAVTFDNETYILNITDNEVSEIDLPGLNNSVRTVSLHQINNRFLIQFTESSSIIIDLQIRESKTQELSQGETVQFVSYDENNTFYVGFNRSIRKYKFNGNSLVDESCSYDFEIDLACMHLNFELGLILVGLWNDTTDNTHDNIHLLDSSNMKSILKTKISSFNINLNYIPRSVLITTFEEKNWFALATTADGSLFYWHIDAENAKTSNCFKDINNPVRAVLSTGPTQLTALKTVDEHDKEVGFIFASCDQPSVIGFKNDKLNFCSVNVQGVNMCNTLNTPTYLNSIVLANNEGILVGSIDSVQKIHIRTKPLHEAPLKIRYFNSTKNQLDLNNSMENDEMADDYVQQNTHYRETENSNVFVLATQHYSHPLYKRLGNKTRISDLKDNDPKLVKAEKYRDDEFAQLRSETLIEDIECNVSILNEQTFELLSCYKLATNELVTSVEVIKLKSEKENEKFGKDYIIVGTGHLDVTEPEPSRGRIHVLEWVESKIRCITTCETEGAVYCMAGIANGKLVAGINSTIVVYNFVNGELQTDARHYNNIIVLNIDVSASQDLIYAGDVFRSVCLIHYNNQDSQMKELARDYNPRYVTSLKAISPVLNQNTIVPADTVGAGVQESASIGSDTNEGNNINTSLNQSSASVSSTTKPKITTAIEQPQSVICTTEEGGLFVAERKHSTDPETKIQLFTTACINLSSYVNSIEKGSLVMRPTQKVSDLLHPETDNMWLLGTRDGSVHALLRLKEAYYDLLCQIQNILRDAYTAFALPSDVPNREIYGKELISLGGIDHHKWRGFSSNNNKRSEGFIDGNLIENLLSMSFGDVETLFKDKLKLEQKPISSEDALRIVEELHRLH